MSIGATVFGRERESLIDLIQSNDSHDSSHLTHRAFSVQFSVHRSNLLVPIPCSIVYCTAMAMVMAAGSTIAHRIVPIHSDGTGPRLQLLFFLFLPHTGQRSRPVLKANDRTRFLLYLPTVALTLPCRPATRVSVEFGSFSCGLHLVEQDVVYVSFPRLSLYSPHLVGLYEKQLVILCLTPEIGARSARLPSPLLASSSRAAYVPPLRNDPALKALVRELLSGPAARDDNSLNVWARAAVLRAA